MNSVISDSRNIEMVRNEMFLLKDLLLPLCRVEEENTFSKGLGQPLATKDGLRTRARYTRTFDRSKECDLGKQYHDVCHVLLNAFVKSFWIEPARIAALEVMSEIHGVSVTGQRTDHRGSRIVLQDYKFQCEWQQALGIDMLVKIALKITGTAPHEMTVDYIRKMPVAC